MKVVGRHKLLDAEEIVLNWLIEGLQNLEGRILVEPGYRKDKYQDWPDFVIISKTHGVIIVECKGFYSEEIRETSNVDLLTRRGVDRYGKQLASYGCRFKELLGNKPIPLTKLVIFPKILSTDPVASWINEFNTRVDDVRVLFNEHLDWPCSLEYLGAPAVSKKLNGKEFEELLTVVNPTRFFTYGHHLNLSEIQKSLSILDMKQTEILEKVETGHHLINGLPGTGKTVLLFKIAEREISLDKQVLFTCFNKPLFEKAKLVLGSQNVKPSQSLFFHLALDHGAHEDDMLSGYEKPVEYLLSRSIKPLFDVILVDEYQDLNDLEIQVLTKLLKPEGLLVLGGDRLQSIRSHRDSWISLGVHIRGHSYFLEKPYRTAASVVDFALSFIGISKTLAREAEVYFKDHKFKHRSGNFEGLNEKLFFMLKSRDEILKEVSIITRKHPEASILIITPSADHNREVAGLRSKRVRVETFQRVKGLEADVVLLYGIDEYLKAETAFPLTEIQMLRSIFSGLCRSRGLVYVHGFEPKSFYYDLRELFNQSLKKRSA